MPIVILMSRSRYGNAIADLLYGDVMPQGKLPLTFPNKDNEQQMTKEMYPGVPAGPYSHQANYSEGQLNGYRWYDKHGVVPAYAFGHGLTYGNMSYSGLTISGRTVTFSVSGTGCDTPQLYLSYPSAATDVTVPAKVLRYFKKVCGSAMGSGAAASSNSLSFTLTDRDVSNWDVVNKKWSVTPGKYGVLVGSSSQDIRLKGTLTVAA
jgi:beta-glucosidase